jgi:hypothetical protein
MGFCRTKLSVLPSSLYLRAIAADSSIGAAGTVPARTGQIATISGCRYSTISTYDGGMFCRKGARDFPHIDFAARSGLPWYKADPGC